MNSELLDAVCKLVDAVLTEHCIASDGNGLEREVHTVDCAVAVLEKIRAGTRNPLEGWANRRLVAHENGYLEALETGGGLEALDKLDYADVVGGPPWPKGN
jgi:hypothetical protein